MNKNETRWGILVLAIFMFFVTLVVADVNGTKNPFYLYVWVMMGYFAYRGEVLKINKWMLALIWLNVFIMFMVAIFMGDKSVGSLYRGWSSKETILIGVCIMLVPKVILYFYTNSLLDTKSNDEKLLQMLLKIQLVKML